MLLRSGYWGVFAKTSIAISMLTLSEFICLVSNSAILGVQARRNLT